MNVRDTRDKQLLLPDQPQIGDSVLSFQWTSALSDQIERLSRFYADDISGAPILFCKLSAGALTPSGVDDTTPQTQDADVLAIHANGNLVDTGHDIKLTNRNNGYYYQNSYVRAVHHPQSGEWHIVSPAGDMVIGKTDGSLSPGGTATLSIYSWNGASWVDTTHNITIRDVFQWTVSASKFVSARLWDYQNLWVPIAAEC